MKTLIKSAIIGLAMLGAVAGSSTAATSTFNATPTLQTSNSTFSFSKFDTNLGSLTAVDLLLNSATVSGNIILNAGSDASGALNSVSGLIRTSGSGMTTSNSTFTSLNFNPTLPVTPNPDTTESFALLGGQSLIGSPLTFSIGSGFWSSYQNSGGTGNTPNFTGRLVLSGSYSSGATDLSLTTSGLASSLSSYTLRYTYTTSPGPSPVPEPGQVAASLLLLGGIGGYVFIKRRRKSAVAAA